MSLGKEFDEKGQKELGISLKSYKHHLDSMMNNVCVKDGLF